MPELTTTAPTAPRRPQRPSTARTLVVLLLVFVFAVSALLASGALDDGIDASEASTRILTPEEIQQMAEDSSSASRSGEESAPVALIAALFLVSGMLLVSLAVPTRAERRRVGAATGAQRKAQKQVPTKVPAKTAKRSRRQAPAPAAPRRQMGDSIPEPVPQRAHVVSSAPVTMAGDDAHTLVLQPLWPPPMPPAPAPLPEPAYTAPSVFARPVATRPAPAAQAPIPVVPVPAPVPVPDPPIERRYRAGAVMRPVARPG